MDICSKQAFVSGETIFPFFSPKNGIYFFTFFSPVLH
nr:MAG TPA: hypothetical protein [Caudoviricetes sp.]